MKKVAASLAGSGTLTELLLISNWDVRDTSVGNELEREHKAQHKSVRKLLGPVGVGATGTAETGVVGIVGSIVALVSLGMSVTTKQEQHID